MSKLRLPPLPPARTWSTYFPRVLGRHAHRAEYPNRIMVTNRQLADEMVRSMKLREGEVVIEVFAGPGTVTRSLLEGGKRNLQDEIRRKAEWWDAKGGQLTTTTADESQLSKDAPLAKDFPAWISYFSPENRKMGLDEETAIKPNSRTASSTIKPALIVATEPAPLMLVRALGMDENVISEHSDPKKIHSDRPICIVEKSKFEKNLVLGCTDFFHWQNLLEILQHPLVYPHLNVHDPSVPPGPEAAKRKWSDPAPPITVVCHMPQGDMGEQMSVQWMTSVIGAAQGEASWAWAWGRMRFAFYTNRNLYDRIMAKPGEMAFCKLSVQMRALYHIEPLAPYHHVVNVDRTGKRVEHRKLMKHQESEAANHHHSLYGNIKQLPRTTTYPLDFHPPPGALKSQRVKNKDPLVRPLVLGMMFTPRKHTLFKIEQRDEWDYVLRHIFVRQASQLSDAISSLGFGADSLMEDVSKPGDYAGRPVSGDTVVRDMDVEDWARIVDVFSQWPFKPDFLLPDAQYGNPDEQTF